ncbi:hypothetical protein M9458_015806, partial [Cirrhinus mrigala]
SFLQVNVTQVHVDECVDADCRGGGGCTSHLSVTDKPAVVDSGSMALLSAAAQHVNTSTRAAPSIPETPATTE